MAKWLKCIIQKGMFSDELTVTLNTRNGEPVALFVPTNAADQRSRRVTVQTFEQQGNVIAVLPDERQSVVDVTAADLLPA